MAKVTRPYKDDQIIERVRALDPKTVLTEPTHSAVSVDYVTDERDDRTILVRVSWTTTVELFESQADALLDGLQ